eukprot:10208_1
MFIADSVCSESSISNNNLFNAYCNHYNATSQSESIYTNNEVWFQYFNGNVNGKCDVTSFNDFSYFFTDQCSQEFNNEINIKIAQCWTAPPEKEINNNDGPTAYDITGYVVLALVLLLPFLIIIIAFLFHRKRKGTDFPSYISLFKFFSGIGDLYTDAIWALALYSETHPLWLYAVIFSFGPHVLSIFVGLYYITKWRQNKSMIHISEFAKSYDKPIIILTLISGFYSTVEIISSHLFHLDVLSFQIGTTERYRILNLKIINNVIFENIPMIVVQYLYLTATTSDSIFDNGLTITLLAIAFSVIAILFGVLTVSVRIFNGFIEVFRKKGNKILVFYEIESSKPNIIQKYHVHTKEIISESCAKALHIDFNQIDIEYIKDITNGIKIKVKFKYLDVNNRDVIANGLLDNTSKLFKDHYTEITNALCIHNPGVVRINILDVQVLKHHSDHSDIKGKSTSPKYVTLKPKTVGETSPTSTMDKTDKMEDNHDINLGKTEQDDRNNKVKNNAAVSIEMHEINDPETLEDYFQD